MTSADQYLRRALEALSAGQPAEALVLCQQALACTPRHPEALHLCAMLHVQVANDVSLAIDLLHQALQARPDFVEARSNLGSLLMSVGALVEAEKHLLQAASDAPDGFATPAYNLGNLWRSAGKLPAAVEAYQQALQHEPGHFASRHNLAATLLDLGKADEALPEALNARAIEPQHPEPSFALGNIYRAMGRLEEAVSAYRQTLTLSPQHGPALTNLANALAEQGRPRESLETFEEAARARPRDARYASNRLCALHYVEETTPELLLQEHRKWEQQFAASPSLPPLELPGQVRTIGLVSADFGQHPVGWFTLPLVEQRQAIDPVRIILYSDRRHDDPVSQRLASAASTFRRIAGYSDQQVQQLIRQDQVDVLVDASGHTGGNRLSLFAGRAAPLQVSWAAYVGTTGLSAMDGLIADSWQVPEREDAFYSEKLLRLPRGYVPWAPPPWAPEVAPPPLTRGHPPTFGSFNNPAKLSDRCIALWSQVLLAVPRSRLLLKFRHLDDPGTAGRLRQRFAACGIEAERLLVAGGSPHAEMLAAYHQVDIALDTTPYSGGLTTLEALWMGVPVLTLPGRTFASRHSLSHLRHIGLEELCASSEADYIQRAVSLAGDGARLQALRQSLRPRMTASATLDGKGFASALLDSLESLLAQTRRQREQA